MSEKPTHVLDNDLNLPTIVLCGTHYWVGTDPTHVPKIILDEFDKADNVAGTREASPGDLFGAQQTALDRLMGSHVEVIRSFFKDRGGVSVLRRWIRFSS